jgi:prophage regulatory protein
MKTPLDRIAEDMVRDILQDAPFRQRVSALLEEAFRLAVARALSQSVMTTKQKRDATDRILTTSDVCHLVTLTRSTIWKLCRSGHFPQPIQITTARKGWRSSAINAWLEERQRKQGAARDYFNRKFKVDGDRGGI